MDTAKLDALKARLSNLSLKDAAMALRLTADPHVRIELATIAWRLTDSEDVRRDMHAIIATETAKVRPGQGYWLHFHAGRFADALAVAVDRLRTLTAETPCDALTTIIWVRRAEECLEKIGPKN